MMKNLARRPHKLRANRKTEYPRRFIFFDTETYRIYKSDSEYIHKLRLGYINYVDRDLVNRKNVDKWIKFTTVDEFWDFLDSVAVRKKRIICIAHNIDFDLQVLDYLNKIKERGYDLVKIITDQRFILEIRKNSCTFLFLDLSNLAYKAPLKVIGKDIGLDKLDVNPLFASDAELEVYCKRDVEIVREYILQLFEYMKSHDLGNFAPTIAGLAFNAFRHKFMKHDIYIHCNPEAIELERKAYRGGRCEAFYIGHLPENDIYYNLDINSMYPYVMREYEYPTKLVKFFNRGNISLLLWCMNKGLVIAEITFRIDEPAIGVKTDRLIFPVGVITASLTSPEIDYVLKNGEILKVHKIALYDSARIFSEYVDFFYNMRLRFIKENKRSYANFSKLMLNSLYGKFGQKIRRCVPVDFTPPDNISYLRYKNSRTGETGVIFKVGDRWYLESGNYEGYDSFVAIAAFVTAYARMYLYKLMKIAGLDNVFYCDTDSLFVNQSGFDNLRDYISENKDLGKLGIKASSNILEIRGAKIYRFGESLKIKGISKPNIIKEEYDQIKFTRTKTSLMKSIFGGVLERVIKKRLSFEYKKGQVLPSGKVLPLLLDDFTNS